MQSWVMRLIFLAIVALSVWVLQGCSPGDKAAEDSETSTLDDRPVETLYAEAMGLFSAGQYTKAREGFEELERQYPFAKEAKAAQMMAAYSAYRALSYEEAALILERFIKLYPNDERTPYAYYLRALCYYDQIVDVGRDQKITAEARQSLRDLVARFPDTDYARDAKIKLDLTDDHLAGKEMQIGRYYQRRQEYLAAANRYRQVIANYQTTSHVPEALHRLVEVNLQLGIKPEAQKYAAVLGYNYPGSEWYRYSYAMLKGDVNPEEAGKGGMWENLVPGL